MRLSTEKKLLTVIVGLFSLREKLKTFGGIGISDILCANHAR